VVPVLKELRDQMEGVRAAELERLCLEDKRLQRPAVEAVWRAFAAGRSHWSRPWALLVLARFGTDRRERLFA